MLHYPAGASSEGRAVVWAVCRVPTQLCSALGTRTLTCGWCQPCRDRWRRLPWLGHRRHRGRSRRPGCGGRGCSLCCAQDEEGQGVGPRALRQHRRRHRHAPHRQHGQGETLTRGLPLADKRGVRAPLPREKLELTCEPAHAVQSAIDSDRFAVVVKGGSNPSTPVRRQQSGRGLPGPFDQV